MKKMYLVYDARGIDDTDNAIVLSSCQSFNEAKCDANDFGSGACVYEAIPTGRKQGKLDCYEEGDLVYVAK